MEFHMNKVLSTAAVMAAILSGNVMASETIMITGVMAEKPCSVGDSGNDVLKLRKIDVKKINEKSVGEKVHEQSEVFNIHDCPEFDGIVIRFEADTVPGFESAIVNDQQPSGDVVAHYLIDNRTTAQPVTYPYNIMLTGNEALKAQTAGGYNFPVLVGYQKIAEVQKDVSPAGATHSVVTLSFSYVK